MSRALLAAGDYLNDKWEKIDDPVQVVAIAYAFNLMGHYAKDSVFLRAHSMRRTGTHCNFDTKNQNLVRFAGLPCRNVVYCIALCFVVTSVN